MKKNTILTIIVVILLVGASLWLYGYFSRKSNDNIPSKDLMLTYYLEDGEAYATEKLSGYKNTQLIEVWGEPDGSLSGFYGDVWKVNMRYTIVVYYYDNKGIVERVKLYDESE